MKLIINFISFFEVIKINNIYSAALYIRLSKEDKDKNVSESVINQKNILLEYVQNNNISNYKIYIDDGYSGTNFNRPSFQNMIEDIKSNKINMVITKDMSRLGRDYIGVGDLIDRFFPLNNIRYVSITDNIDSYLDNYSNELAPFKAIINDMYARDISKKIRASLRIKQKEGKWVGARPPYGYKIDKKDKNHLIIDSLKSKIVKDIYDKYLNGLTISEIVDYLNNNKIKTPSEYHDFKYKKRNIKYGVWSSKTIKDILTNPIYTGNMVQNRRCKLNYKVNKIIKNKSKDYIIVNTTHKPIIKNSTYLKVQEKIKTNITNSKRKDKILLNGLLYCYECKSKIIISSRRKKDNRCYTICSNYKKNKSCTLHSNNYDLLEKNILDYIKKNIDKNEICNKLNIDNDSINEIIDNILKERNNLIKIIEKIELHSNKIIDIYLY